jgi:hypothetical protein
MLNNTSTIQCHKKKHIVEEKMEIIIIEEDIDNKFSIEFQWIFQSRYKNEYRKIANQVYFCYIIDVRYRIRVKEEKHLAWISV